MSLFFSLENPIYRITNTRLSRLSEGVELIRYGAFPYCGMVCKNVRRLISVNHVSIYLFSTLHWRPGRAMRYGLRDFVNLAWLVMV
jgi:hypothetical protein